MKRKRIEAMNSLKKSKKLLVISFWMLVTQNVYAFEYSCDLSRWTSGMPPRHVTEAFKSNEKQIGTVLDGALFGVNLGKVGTGPGAHLGLQFLVQDVANSSNVVVKNVSLTRTLPATVKLKIYLSTNSDATLQCKLLPKSAHDETQVLSCHEAGEHCHSNSECCGSLLCWSYDEKCYQP